MRIITKKTISKECWNLDYALIRWINEHLKVYKEDANKIVNLEFYSFMYKGKEYTQLEILDRLIEITDYLLDADCFFGEGEKINKSKDEMYDLLKLVHWTLWW